MSKRFTPRYVIPITHDTCPSVGKAETVRITFGYPKSLLEFAAFFFFTFLTFEFLFFPCFCVMWTVGNMESRMLANITWLIKPPEVYWRQSALIRGRGIIASHAHSTELALAFRREEVPWKFLFWNWKYISKWTMVVKFEFSVLQNLPRKDVKPWCSGRGLRLAGVYIMCAYCQLTFLVLVLS